MHTLWCTLQAQNEAGQTARMLLGFDEDSAEKYRVPPFDTIPLVCLATMAVAVVMVVVMVVVLALMLLLSLTSRSPGECRICSSPTYC